MFKVKLEMYKKSKPYFLFFDTLLKDFDINKEFYLKKIGISPSTYRKARTIEQNIGNKIIEQLCNELKYKIMSNDEVNEIEILFNKIYLNMYYKIYDSFDIDLQKIEYLINQKYILNPILVLLKLFLLANSKIDVREYKINYLNEYLYLKKYTKFFNEDLLEIMDILSFIFEQYISKNNMLKKYENSLAYFSLASRLCDDKKYVDCLFVSKKAEEALVREKNYKRLLFLNIKVMFCLNSIYCYKECFDLASAQLLTLQSFIDTSYEYKYTIRNLSICCIALKKYDYISNLLIEQSSLSMIELCCLLISYFKINQLDYIRLYKKYYNMIDEEEKTIISALDRYLQYNDKKELSKLDLGKWTDCFIFAIKKA